MYKIDSVPDTKCIEDIMFYKNNNKNHCYFSRLFGMLYFVISLWLFEINKRCCRAVGVVVVAVVVFVVDNNEYNDDDEEEEEMENKEKDGIIEYTRNVHMVCFVTYFTL